MENNIKTILLTIIVLLSITVSSYAQTEIKSPLYSNKDSNWYADQAEKWKEVINKDNTNENAWENYYFAMKFSLLWNKHTQDNWLKVKEVIEQMKNAIPNSFAYYLCSYSFLNNLEKNENIEKAMLMKPDDTKYYDIYASYLLKTGDYKNLGPLYQKWFESGSFSKDLINYFYNEIASADKGSIIIVNGDVSTFASGIIQNALNLFNDIQIICLPILSFEGNYRNSVFEKLKIKPFNTFPDKEYNDYDKYCIDMIKYIAKESGRPLYLSSTAGNILNDMKDSLYSEGLLLRYSTKPYDNITKTAYNFTNVYLTDYLLQNFTPIEENNSVHYTSLNFVVCLKSLLSYYKKSGDKNNYEKLYNLLNTIIEKNSKNMSPSVKQEYLKCLK